MLLKHPPHLNRTYFESLIFLLKYVDIRSKTVDLVRFNLRIRQMAMPNLHPPVEWFSELVSSKEKEDIEVR